MSLLLLEPLAAKRRIDITENYLTNNTVISADAQRLAQMLTNIVGNAIKYSAPETSITVKTGKVESVLEIIVSDEGCGIFAEQMSRIFENFTARGVVMKLKSPERVWVWRWRVKSPNSTADEFQPKASRIKVRHLPLICRLKIDWQKLVESAQGSSSPLSNMRNGLKIQNQRVEKKLFAVRCSLLIKRN